MLVMPQEGLVQFLADALSVAVTYVHLYRTDTPLGPYTTVADLVELDVPGYSPRRTSAWSPPLIVAGRAVSSADPIMFTRVAGTPSRQVFGYYVTEGLHGPLLWAQRGAAAPYPMGNAPDRLLIVPRIALGPCGGPLFGLGDSVGDGSSTVPSVTAGGGDSVGDGVTTFGPPGGHGLGDSVGDGEGVVPPGPTSGGGDSVGDGVTTFGPPGGHGLGDSVGDGEGTPGPPPGLGEGDSVGDGEGTGS